MITNHELYEFGNAITELYHDYEMVKTSKRRTEEEKEKLQIMLAEYRKAVQTHADEDTQYNIFDAVRRNTR